MMSREKLDLMDKDLHKMYKEYNGQLSSVEIWFDDHDTKECLCVFLESKAAMSMFAIYCKPMTETEKESLISDLRNHPEELKELRFVKPYIDEVGKNIGINNVKLFFGDEGYNFDIRWDNSKPLLAKVNKDLELVLK